MNSMAKPFFRVPCNQENCDSIFIDPDEVQSIDVLEKNDFHTVTFNLRQGEDEKYFGALQSKITVVFTERREYCSYIEYLRSCNIIQ